MPADAPRRRLAAAVLAAVLLAALAAVAPLGVRTGDAYAGSVLVSARAAAPVPVRPAPTVLLAAVALPAFLLLAARRRGPARLAAPARRRFEVWIPERAPPRSS